MVTNPIRFDGEKKKKKKRILRMKKKKKKKKRQEQCVFWMTRELSHRKHKYC